MKKILSLIAMGGCLLSMSGAPTSILDLKHSITDDNVITPESFEVKSRELEENFYLKHYADRSKQPAVQPALGNAEEYEKLLSQIPAEIELPYNSIVGKFIDMYLGKRRDLVADMLALDNYYGEIFVEELIKENMPLELQYLPVIESALNPNAVSRAGAAGLWQLMPKTATGLGLEVNSLVDQRRDPYLSTKYAVKYLKQLYEIYNDWTLAIAAYNCGPGNVNKALKRAGGDKKDYWEIYSYLLPETRGYVPAFIAANFVMHYYNQYGIRPTLQTRKLVTDSVMIDKRVHFNQIAEVLNIPVEEIRMLNPQFRKDVIPGDNHPYMLILPSHQVLSYIMSENAIMDNNADTYARRTSVEPGESTTVLDDGTTIRTRMVTTIHTVGRGENLSSIAKKYGVSAADIKRWNNLKSGKVKQGAKLTIETYERVTDADLFAENNGDNAETETSGDGETVDNPRERGEMSSTNPPNVEIQPIVTPAPSVTESTNKNTQQQKTTPKNNTTKYKVKKGDTLGKIARNYHTTVKAIQNANGLKDTKIRIGQTLKIPTK